jgi:hypothetical protein
MAKKVVVLLAVAFALYALVAEPQRSAQLVRDAMQGLLAGAGAVAASLFAFFDELV